MSYILDALKKLENEKFKKNNGSGMVNISGELLREDHRRPSGGGAWKIVVVVLAASLLTFGTTYFFLKDGKMGGSKNHPVPTPLSTKTVVPRPLLSAPAPQQPVKSQAQARPSIKPVLPAVPSTVPRESKSSQPVRSRLKSRPAHDKPLTSISQQEVPIVSASPPRTDIKVSGIAWQDERSARRAVVNGFLMREQGVVAGAKIVEILQDRVRFSQAGTTFEVPLIASGQPEPRK